MALYRQLVWSCIAAFILVAPAWADLCDAPFMRDNGQVQLTGSGALQMGADLVFANVTKSSKNQCEARVRGTTTFGFMGIPARESELDYWMTVRNGEATFERIEPDGRREPVEGRFDLRLLGLFSYGEHMGQAGQTFPARTFQIQVDKKSVDAEPVVVRTGQKTVGNRDTISTASGEQSCWPIRYTRVIDPVKVSFSGVTLPLPGMTSEVTDWFCPRLNMVMKQESLQTGMSSVVEVTRIN